jgi:hypothetical protein
MPARPVQQHDAILVGEVGGGLRQEQRHGFGIDPRQHEGGKSAVQGADGGQRVGIFPDDLLADGGATRPRGPATPMIAEAPEARFVLK